MRVNRAHTRGNPAKYRFGNPGLWGPRPRDSTSVWPGSSAKSFLFPRQADDVMVKNVVNAPLLPHWRHGPSNPLAGGPRAAGAARARDRGTACALVRTPGARVFQRFLFLLFFLMSTRVLVSGYLSTLV